MLRSTHLTLAVDDLSRLPTLCQRINLVGRGSLGFYAKTTSFILMKDNIETEGIFRVSPHTILIGVLQEAYDRSQKYILWKENGVTLPCPNNADAKDAQPVIDEVDCREAYGVALAASLIKVWYRDLKQPIFRVSSYQRLREEFGNLQEPPAMTKIVDLLSDHSHVNILTPISRIF